MSFADVNTGYAVGFEGTTLSTAAGSSNWVTQASGTTSDLYEVYFVNATTGWAVGESRTILSTKATTTNKLILVITPG